MALHALDPDGPLAEQFTQLALLQSIEVVSRLHQSKFDQGELTSFLKESMIQMIAKLLGSNLPPGSVWIDLQKKVQELGIQGDDKDAASKFINDNFWVVEFATNFMVTIGSTRWDGYTFNERIEKWAQNPETPGWKVKILAASQELVTIR